MALKVDDPRDVQGAYDDRFNEMAQSHYDDEFKKIADAEKRGSETGSGEASANSNDLGDDVRNRENTGGGWANNVTGKSASQNQRGLKGVGQKAKVLFKKKGATAAIIALLGGGAAIPFLGTASLPFSILGNQDSKSMMHGLQQYTDDYMGFRIFNSKSGSVSTTSSKIKGLRDTEIAELKANGVDFEGGKYNSVTKKTTFTGVKFEGQTYHAGTEFQNAMRSNAAFRNSMVFTRGSYWKSSKSAFAAKVKSLFKIDPNPDLSGKDDKARNQKLMAESIEGVDSHPSAQNTQEQKDKNGVDPNASEKAKAMEVAGDLQGEITAETQALANGDISPALAADSNNGNIGQAMGREGTDLAGDATKGLGGKVWGYVNALGPVDTMCTIYNVANTANVLARTVALANIIRFAMTIRATIEKAKAGDDDGESTRYLMDLIQQKDPTTGQSFDETSYAALLFSGTLSSEPSAVSAIGGQAMLALYMSMHAVHSLFGKVAEFASLGLASGSASSGRNFLKTVCSIAQNVGVQIAATVGSLVVGFFSGGSSVAAEAGVMTSIKLGFQSAIKTITESIGKDAIKKFLESEGKKVAEDGILRYAAKGSWKAFTKIYSSMSGWDKLGLLAAGASAFGMGYIVDTLAGGNIAGFLKNGFSAFMGFGTGWDAWESKNAIASGGNMATYGRAAAYQETQQTYDNAYVADMQYQAKDTPFDLKNPYSMLGSAMFGMQKTIGISASLSLPSTLLSVASLPFNIPSLFVAHADSTPPTPKEIGDQVQDPFYKDNSIAVTVTASPQIIFQKQYSFQDILDKLVDVPNPQVSYSGNDPTTGEPQLSIIPGTDLDAYAQKCHNPEKTEADPEFANDDNSNTYDTDTCMQDGKNYKPEYQLYDDAIRFIGQVSPDSTDGTGSSATTSVAAGTSGQDDVPAKFRQMAESCIQSTGKACGSGDVWLGMEPGQCASFAAWRAAQQWYGAALKSDGSNLEQLLHDKPLPGFGSTLALGNGNQVAPALIANKMADPVKSLADTQPGDIVSVRDSNSAGHVFVILSNNNGQITIEDYNAAGGPGKYGTTTAAGKSLYSQANVVAIARVHRGGGAN
jgi:hypothetical protein